MNGLTRQELSAVLKVARAHSENDWLMFTLQYLHAMRISEVLALTHANFHGAPLMLTVQRLKGSLLTTQPLVDVPDFDEAAGVARLLEITPTGQPLFTLEDGSPLTKQNANYRWKKYARIAGLPNHLCHTHVLRHSRAHHTIKAAGIENVRQLCGHSSIASTGHYLRVSDESAWKSLGMAAGL